MKRAIFGIILLNLVFSLLTFSDTMSIVENSKKRIALVASFEGTMPSNALTSLFNPAEEKISKIKRFDVIPQSVIAEQFRKNNFIPSEPIDVEKLKTVLKELNAEYIFIFQLNDLKVKKDYTSPKDIFDFFGKAVFSVLTGIEELNSLEINSNYDISFIKADEATRVKALNVAYSYKEKGSINTGNVLVDMREQMAKNSVDKIKELFPLQSKIVKTEGSRIFVEDKNNLGFEKGMEYYTLNEKGEKQSILFVSSLENNFAVLRKGIVKGEITTNTAILEKAGSLNELDFSYKLNPINMANVKTQVGKNDLLKLNGTTNSSIEVKLDGDNYIKSSINIEGGFGAFSEYRIIYRAGLNMTSSGNGSGISGFGSAIGGVYSYYVTDFILLEPKIFFGLDANSCQIGKLGNVETNKDTSKMENLFMNTTDGAISVDRAINISNFTGYLEPCLRISLLPQNNINLYTEVGYQYAFLNTYTITGGGYEIDNNSTKRFGEPNVSGFTASLGLRFIF